MTDPTPSALPFPPHEVAARLLAWYDGEGRDLPWRHTRDPYAIWLSEVMLQQTGVETVIPYYRAFLERYPTVAALAAAPIEEVIELWAGLGYYRRARNLHSAARQVMRDHGGCFPASLAGLQALPGVGRSTAGAILSIAFDTPAPILDGNVRRVLCRLFALHGDPRSSAAEKRLWRWAEELTSQERPHDYAQAIMDLGAILCTPRRPACDRCPLAGLCEGYRQGLAEGLPEARPRKQLPVRRQVALVLEGRNGILVNRRGLDGMLAGLWEFPACEIAEGDSPDSAAAGLAAELGGAQPARLGSVRHLYSHFRLETELYLARYDADPIAATQTRRWVPRAELQRLALHGAHLKALPLLAAEKEHP